MRSGNSYHMVPFLIVIIWLQIVSLFWARKIRMQCIHYAMKKLCNYDNCSVELPCLDTVSVWDEPFWYNFVNRLPACDEAEKAIHFSPGVVAIAALPYPNSSQAFKHSDQFNCSPVHHSQSVSCSVGITSSCSLLVFPLYVSASCLHCLCSSNL